MSDSRIAATQVNPAQQTGFSDRSALRSQCAQIAVRCPAQPSAATLWLVAPATLQIDHRTAVQRLVCRIRQRNRQPRLPWITDLWLHTLTQTIDKVSDLC